MAMRMREVETVPAAGAATLNSGLQGVMSATHGVVSVTQGFASATNEGVKSATSGLISSVGSALSWLPGVRGTPAPQTRPSKLQSAEACPPPGQRVEEACEGPASSASGIGVDIEAAGGRSGAGATGKSPPSPPTSPPDQPAAADSSANETKDRKDSGDGSFTFKRKGSVVRNNVFGKFGTFGTVGLEGSDDWTSPFFDERIVDATLLLTTAIKFADLGHAWKPQQIHQAWTRRITDVLALGFELSGGSRTQTTNQGLALPTCYQCGCVCSCMCRSFIL